MNRIKLLVLVCTLMLSGNLPAISQPSAGDAPQDMRNLIPLPANLLPVPLPGNLPQGHPRLMVGDAEKENVRRLVETEGWAKEVMLGIHHRIDDYVDRHVTDSEWMPSRLMMYWKSRATNVYIKGGIYSHADGEAPVPTVRFGSTRGVHSPFKRPKLEDIIPYMDDTKGVYFHNADKEGNPLEWTDQANVSDSNIESINEQITGLARDAAFVYWLTGSEKFARFAFDLFDTYMTGMYYRNEPTDLNNGHAQTLAGLSTFEVIQERILRELAYLYDFLHSYISMNHRDKIEMYEVTFKKWVDLTIKNGVPQNNWNLHQAKFILKVAMVLDDNANYPDGKGREYYIDYILNRTSSRQWSLTKFIEYGYDENTGVWAECPGYAQGVTKDLTSFIRDYDNTFDQNLLPYIPVMRKAVAMLPQYLFPNMMVTAFGDTHYGGIHTGAFGDMISMARKYGDRDGEIEFTRMYKLFEPNAGTEQGQKQQSATAPRLPAQVSSLFTGKPLELDKSIAKGELKDYITQTFYAPNVSWFVQRSGYDSPEHGLMISQVASLGNHAHANGVSIELYGKGYVLGAESGRGSSYFQPDYLEYYSQFPAHNTVMVDGISSYPEMLSNHPFDLLSCYPLSGQKEGFFPDITFSDVWFLEPESRSDQNRLLSIVRTGETTGYYVDIFRSKKQRGGDKFHDYFYHNLGQELSLTDSKDVALDLQPNSEMAFAGGHLFALDYIWDKRSVKTDDDYRAVWKMTVSGGNNVYMHLWMKGCPGREVFSVKAPPTKAFGSNHGIPYKVEEHPYLTIAARQHGEAWTRPFVSVFEPATDREPVSIRSVEYFEPEGTTGSFAGLKVESLTDRTDYIFSSDVVGVVTHADMKFSGSYGVVTIAGSGTMLFLGHGTLVGYGAASLKTVDEPGAAAIAFSGEKIFITAEVPVVLTLEDTYPKGKIIFQAGDLKIEGQRLKDENRRIVNFRLPALSYQEATIQIFK